MTAFVSQPVSRTIRVPAPDLFAQPLSGCTWLAHVTPGALPNPVRHTAAVLRARLARQGWPPDAVPLAEFIACELIGNAVRHGLGFRRLTMGGCATRVFVVTVADGRPDFPGSFPAEVDPLAESGRGLPTVHRYATRWGWYPGGRGKVVWCRLDPARLC